VPGEPVAIAEDGSFSVALPAGAGLDAIRVDAVDADGNASDRIVGVARGPVLPLELPLDPAVHIALSTTGVQAVSEQIGATLTEAWVLAELVAANPLFSDIIAVGGFPVSLQINATDVRWASLSTGVRLGEGLLGVDLTITDLVIDTEQRVRFGGVTQTLSGSFTDSSTTISMDFSLVARARGDLDITSTRSALTFTSPDYNSGGYAIPSSFGLDLEAILDPLVAPVVADATAAALEDQLEAIALDAPLDLLGTTVDFTGAIRTIAVGVDGIAIGLDGLLSGAAVDPTMPPAPGSLGAAGPAPTPADSAADLSFALSPILIQRALHMAWQGGVFESTISASDLGIEPALLDLLFPGAESLDLQVHAELPAAIRGTESGVQFDLVALDLRCSGLRDGSAAEFVHAKMHVQAPVSLSNDASGAITAEIGEPTVSIDVIEREGLSVTNDTVAAAEALELRLAAVATAFVGELLPRFSVLVPEVPGLALRTERVGAAGAESDWIRAECSL
jgi:hypothetical protein